MKLWVELYRIPFLIEEKHSVYIIIGTQFLNSHVDEIWCRQKRTQLKKVEIPILSSGNKRRPMDP